MALQHKYEIGPFWSSERNTDVQLNLYVSDQHFRIDLFTANFEASQRVLKEYLLHVEHSDPEYIPPLPDNPDEDDMVDPIDEFYEWATKPFLPLFREIPLLDKDRVYTLQDCLFPKQLRYTLQLAGEELVPTPLDSTASGRPVGALLPPSKKPNKSLFPVYRPNDIHVTLSDDAVALPPQPGKVYIEGRNECFLKIINPGDVGMTVRELSTYTKIHSAGLGDDVYVSKLLGIVEDEQTSRTVGLLLLYIECENKTLLCARRNAGYASQREKWLHQITNSVHELHKHEIVWGDAKPDNVLIDRRSDAYLIDFGGGYTKRWVDKELVNTAKGDLQGLQRIKEYILKEKA